VQGRGRSPASKRLAPRIYVAVVTFNGDAELIVPMRRVEDGQAIVKRIRRIGAGGGTNSIPA